MKVLEKVLIAVDKDREIIDCCLSRGSLSDFESAPICDGNEHALAAARCEVANGTTRRLATRIRPA